MANRTVLIQTSRGDIKATLEEDRAPITTGNFVDLIGRGHYNGLTFHRYVEGFVIQGGDPRGDGTGGFVDPATGRERRVQLEVRPDLKHDRAGTLAMARSQEPNSASCQFYMTLAPAPFLDNNYAVFGYVTEGQDAMMSLRQGDRIESISFVE